MDLSTVYITISVLILLSIVFAPYYLINIVMLYWFLKSLLRGKNIFLFRIIAWVNLASCIICSVVFILYAIYLEGFELLLILLFSLNILLQGFLLNRSLQINKFALFKCLLLANAIAFAITYLLIEYGSASLIDVT